MPVFIEDQKNRPSLRASSLFGVLALLIYTGCSGAGGSAGTGLPTTGGSGIPAGPTGAGVLSPAHSEIQVSSSKAVLGQTLTFTLIGKDPFGTPVSGGGAEVIFSLADGTSSGTIAATIDHGDGTYSAEMTASQQGSPTTVRASVNSVDVTTDFPVVQVFPGAFHRTVSLSPATDQSDYQVRLVLNASNFNYSAALAGGEDLRFVDASENTLTYWIERWDNTGDSIIWVKTKDSGTSQFELYYGNAGLTAASDQFATFSYASPKATYAELSSEVPTGSNLGIASYVSGNYVTVSDVSGNTSQLVDLNGIFTFENVVQGLITASGGISGRVLNFNKGFDTIAPLVFSGKVAGYPKSRSNPDHWEFFNPTSSVASVTLSNYNHSGTLVGTTQVSVDPGSFKSLSHDVATFGLIESDSDILSFYNTRGDRDGEVLMPASTDLYGVNSKNLYVGITEDGTSGTVYYSGGGFGTFSGDKGKYVKLNSGGSQGNARGVYIVTDKPVVATSQADSDGWDSMAFWPKEELDRTYLLPAEAQYVSITCPYETTITVTNPDGSPNTTQPCTPSGISPGFLYLGTKKNNINFATGTRIESPEPFFMYYEYSTQDETNILGPKHGRLYSENPPVISVGSEAGI